MNDLISRKMAIDAMKKLEKEDIERYGVSIPEGFYASEAIEALQALPSIKEEIIRCEDCKYFDKHNYECNNDYWYTEILSGDLIGISIQPWKDFYCYYGERKG